MKNVSNIKYLESEMQEEGEIEREISRKLATTKKNNSSIKFCPVDRDIIIKAKKIYSQHYN